MDGAPKAGLTGGRQSQHESSGSATTGAGGAGRGHRREEGSGLRVQRAKATAMDRRSGRLRGFRGSTLGAVGAGSAGSRSREGVRSPSKRDGYGVLGHPGLSEQAKGRQGETRPGGRPRGGLGGGSPLQHDSNTRAFEA